MKMQGLDFNFRQSLSTTFSSVLLSDLSSSMTPAIELLFAVCSVEEPLNFLYSKLSFGNLRSKKFFRKKDFEVGKLCTMIHEFPSFERTGQL